jgi:YD repeat-containing protein
MIAALLLTILLTNTLAPTITYALTSGPTAPEATSFEPIDTTDMINLQTGDLSYNIPLLEVPGPEGGYPLSLSYHAGIQPNEDASWVGLGWSLNPGAITRSVNGYPDDWYVPQQSRRDYWSGGQTTTYEVGVSIGIANTPATVSFGLSFSQDTYRGFGVGFYAGAGMRFGLSDNVGLNASVRVGVSAYGDGYASGGVGIGIGAGSLNASVGVGFSTNFESLNAGFSGGVGYSIKSAGQQQSLGGSLLGASISTGSGKPSFEVGGLSASVSNSKAGNIQTSGTSFGIDIPVYYGINLSLGYSKVRYWSDETVSVYTHGSIYGSGWAVTDNAAYDTYSLLEEPSEKNIIDYPDPSTLQGGAYPDFDVYSVNAQGLGGNMRPYLFQGEVLRQNVKSGSTPKVTYFSPAVTNIHPSFRFQSDFSNSYRQNYPAYSNPDLNLRLVAPPMDANPVFGDNDGNYSVNYTDGFTLSGSKRIDLHLGIKPYKAAGYNRTDRLFDGHMIEGYSITNESGVVYHFGLPAYSWGEENYQERIDRSGGLAFNRLNRSSPYAYTWYLTTITGPDFVDRNNNQIADDGDWGYWINFDYGKWSDNYVWRNPSEGYQRDEDNQFKNCSMGKKEVYYLNAIRTRTHIALFEKELRFDGKGAAPAVFNKFGSGSAETDYAVPGRFDATSSQSLRLNTIYLLNAADSNFVLPTSGYSEAYRPVRAPACANCELPNNILDKTDVDAIGRSALEARSIRVIDFKYDYSLCPGTSNSFDSYGTGNANVKTGKLTLNALVNRGKGGANMLPPMKFEYEIPAEDSKTATGSLTATSFSTTTAVFQKGDLLVTNNAQNTYCGVVTQVTANAGTTTYQLANSSYTASAGSIPVKTTKNPPYNKDGYDMWGMYKSDYNTSVISSNENLGRRTTPVSAKTVDAWSLRQITTVLGSKIKLNYEPDVYIKSVLNKDYALIMKNFTVQTDRKTLQCTLDAIGFEVSDVVTSGLKYKIVLLADYLAWGYTTDGPLPVGYIRRALDETTIGEFTITSVSGSTITGVLDNVIPNQFQDASDQVLTFENKVTTGNLSTNINSNFYGGGVRIASVTVNAGFSNITTSTTYNYDVNNVSSGITSYLPNLFDAVDVTAALDNPSNSYISTVASLNSYRAKLYRNINSLLAIAREVPPPAVMYEYVTVTSSVKNADETEARPLETSTQYQMEVFRENMAGRKEINTMQQGSNSLGTYYARNWAIKKFVTGLGNIKRIVQYDKQGRKVSETINHYLHDGLENLPFGQFMDDYKNRLAQFKYQGFLQERYAEVKEVSNQPKSSDNGVKATLSAKEEYPCIAIGQTVINYVNGTQTRSDNLAYDFYSGAITKTVETDAYGNRIMTEVTPAYRKYAQMGLTNSTTKNKNMLTQTAGTNTWKVDANNNPLGLVSASVNTWGNSTTVIDKDGNSLVQNINSITTGNIWRSQSSYSWQPDVKTSDGLTTPSNFVEFNWSAPASSNASWIKTSDITLYDVNSKALEAKDVNSNYSATHMGYNNTKVVLSGGPANYYEIAYSGAEDETVNGTNNIFIKKADGIVSTGTGVTHTGTKSLKLGVLGKKGFTYTVNTNNLVAGKSYRASVWVKPTSGTASDVKLYYDINGTVKATSVSSGSSAKTAAGWRLINLVINGSDITAGNTLTVGCTNDHATVEAYIDDMRFRPVEASTTAYVYDAFSGELTHILDNSNWYTRFEYDAAGRLVKTYVEKNSIGEIKTSNYEYNYGTYTTYPNDAINETFSRNNCPTGQVGGSITINVPAGTVTSVVSKPDANAMARSYAQAQANSQGSCYVPAVTVVLSNNAAVSGYRAIFNDVGYNFPASGTSTVTISPGTYTIGIAPTGGGGSTHTFRYESGPNTETQTGASATFTNVTVVHGNTITLYIN